MNSLFLARRLRPFSLALLCWAANAAAPTVTRVEPPSWWAGHSLSPVRLLIQGDHLTGTRLQGDTDLSPGTLTLSTNGHWAFVDLAVSSSAKPGPHTLTLSNSDGAATVAFEVRPKLTGKHRFQGFTTDDVIYLLMPDRFANGDPSNDDPPVSAGLHDRSKARFYHGGDLEGIRRRLSYLRDLGITALWPTPWYDNANQLNRLERYTPDNQRTATGRPITDYHGYGAVDFYGVEEHFGSLPGLRRLVDAAHRSGLKVIQDQVANHTGPYHPWATNSPTPTWYNGTVAAHLENTWQTWTIADPNPPADKLKATLDGWFINLLPDLNQNDPECGTYLIQNSLWWIGMTGLDAVRQDTLPYVPRTHWHRWTAALKREYPHLTILGEMWDGNPKLVSFFQGGQARFDGVDSGIDTLFDFPLHYAIRDVFAKGQSMSRLRDTLAADTNYVNPQVLVTFLGLHDTARFLNEPGATPDGLRQAFTFLLTTRGTPLIYYGDEIGMRGGTDPDNRRDFPGGWPEDAQNAFTASGRTPEQAAIHDHVRKLLKLRRQLEPLRRGALHELLVTDTTYVFARNTKDRSVVIAMNNDRQSRSATVPLASGNIPASGFLTDRLGSLGRCKVKDGILTITLPPRTSAVLVP